VEHIHDIGELDRVNRAIGVSIPVFDDLDDTCAAEAAKNLCMWMLAANLCKP